MKLNTIKGCIFKRTKDQVPFSQEPVVGVDLTMCSLTTWFAPADTQLKEQNFRFVPSVEFIGTKNGCSF